MMDEIIGNIDASCIMMYSCNCGKDHQPNEGILDAGRITGSNLIASTPSPKLTDATDYKQAQGAR